MALPSWFKVATIAVLCLLLVIDLVVVARRPHAPSLREASLWVTFYVGLALGFATVLLVVGDAETAGSFIAGWLTEYSLSIDNLFVFVVLMARFAVPAASQQKILMFGIILSLPMRGGFILVGVAAIERFTWVFYLFGCFLVYTAIQLVRSGTHAQAEYRENAIVRRLARVLPVASNYDGARLLTTVGGRRMATPLVLVLVAIATADLLFALDSIPAIFGLTTDPFIVFSATIFALMGLRQLYFLLGGLLDRLVYLSIGLAVVLAFVGAKLFLEALHTNELQFVNGGDPIDWLPVISAQLSLAVIVVVLVLTTLASLLATRERTVTRRGRDVT